MATLYELLKVMIEKGASDLHISTGTAPRLRIDGKLMTLDQTSLISSETKSLCYSILTDAQKHSFEEDRELDVSFGVKGLSRFRANIFLQRGAVAGAFRTIPFNIRSFKELGLPDIVVELTKKPRGLILVTGPTGCGKSTTLATMVDRINEERYEHIITVEDPIEYLHSHKKCLINQREVHADTESFNTALRRVLRQDPDIVLIGEMRDLETIQAALTVAETGHLTLPPPPHYLNHHS
ncbi:MAG: PilT/PilU family type 4a pilus ATPase, partial [Candidatus Mariimomonas ferrooxydans]